MYLHYASSSYDIAQNISHVRADRFLIHSHPYYEIHFVIRGDMEMLYAGQTVRVKPYGMTMIEANVPHGIRVMSEEPYERYTVHFTEDLLPAKALQLLLRIFKRENFPGRNNHLPGLGSTNFLQLFQEMIRMCALPKEQRDLLAPAMIQTLLTSIYVHMLDIAPLPERREKAAFTAQDVRNYIDIHYIEKLSMEQLSAVFYCSKGHLNNIFRREMGMPVMQYVLHRRLRYAQALIENGYSAGMAGVSAGFPDYSNFYRAYVKHFGEAPSRSAPAERVNPPDDLLPQLPMSRPHILEEKQPPSRNVIWDLYSPEGTPEEDPSYLVDT